MSACNQLNLETLGSQPTLLKNLRGQIATYNWLDLETLGSRPFMPKNLPIHW